MSGINTRGVIVGGLVAGLIINISEAILNMPVLGAEMETALRALNLPAIGGSAIGVFVVMSFLVGIALVWLYAAIRPRFGPGPKTALIAAAFVWFLGYFYPSVGFGVMGFLPWRLLNIALIWGVVEVVVAALVGARLYTEGATAHVRA
jgi:hypothetical protein